jgi:hypothetical protein
LFTRFDHINANLKERIHAKVWCDPQGQLIQLLNLLPYCSFDVSGSIGPN